MTTANAAAAGKNSEKSHEKLVEKRRALGRGLESLLPGPRVVATSPALPTPTLPPPTLPQSARKDGAPASTLPPDATSSQLSVVSPQSGSDGAAVARPGVAGRVGQWQAAADGEVHELAIGQIDRNPYQTRAAFNKEALEELSRSIKVQGVVQPIMVRPGAEGRFILILGERRLRASMMAELTTIPAIVRRVSEQQAAEITLVENLQRQDLNCIEQAEAFANLSTQFKLTQDEIGMRAGISRETVSNYMRLLNLPESVIGALLTGKLTYSHARVLLQLRDDAEIWKFAKKAMEEKMSVTNLEELVLGSGLPRPGAVNRSGGARWVDPNVKAAQRSLEEVLGMRVRISDRRGRGKISIEYATLEDFDRVVGMLKGR
jgi:ParB family chromosome partitioning protein